MATDSTASDGGNKLATPLAIVGGIVLSIATSCGITAASTDTDAQQPQESTVLYGQR